MQFVDYDKKSYHYARLLGVFYKKGVFMLLPFLSEDCELIIDSETGRSFKGNFDIHQYYNKLNIPEYSFYEVVIFEGDDNKSLDGKIGLLLNRFEQGDVIPTETVVYFELNSEGLISKIIYNNKPELFNFHEFLLPRNFEQDDKFGNQRHPEFDGDNNFNEQELINLGNMATHLMLEDYGYKIKYMQPRLNKTPNIVAEKDGENLYISVLGVASEDLSNIKVDGGLFPYKFYSKYLPDVRLLKLQKEIAHKENAKYNFCLVFFTSSDQEELEQGIVSRGNNFEYDVCWLDEEDLDQHIELMNDYKGYTEDDLKEGVEACKRDKYALLKIHDSNPRLADAIAREFGYDGFDDEDLDKLWKKH